MESLENIRKAKETVRSHISGSYKPRSRTHTEAREENSHRLRALCGICGSCANLKLEFGHKDGKDVVSLRCTAGVSPLKLYEETELGVKPECPSFKERR
ncbi:MAG: hypothetical protein HY044_04580 [Candidatus Woesebacteria bacterium]|nr:MAG: hypothetical protein HY044_04580 [Candidatus Woesebacteria bacterium]